MTIPAEVQAKIDQLAAQVTQLTAQNTQLVDAQVTSAMQVREAEAVGLCEKLGLPNTEVEINFAEIGSEATKAKTGWKPFLVSLSEQQFQAFTELSNSLAKSSSGGGSALMFSEFDKPETKGTIELSEADAQKLSVRVSDARQKALTAYSTGRPLA